MNSNTDGNTHALRQYEAQQQKQEEAQAGFDTEMENYVDALEAEHNKLSMDDTQECQKDGIHETISLLVEEMRDWAKDYLGFDFTDEINKKIIEITDGEY